MAEENLVKAGEISSELSSTTTPNPEIGEDVLKPRQRRERQEEETVNAIIADQSLSEPAKIDRLAKARSWFHGDTSTVDAYLFGTLDLSSAVEKLAGPIDHTYSTANDGRMYHGSEMTARNQRSYHSPEQALKLWGEEQEWPDPGPYKEEWLTTEGQLWRLWYGVLHAAKRIPWDDEAQQKKLLELVMALKSRPDPPAPEPMTIPLRRDWIWSSGTVWSNLLMLGPSARESWNDGCGCASGWTEPERHAWTNVNAFVARLTASGTADFRTYAMWALRDALEQGIEKSVSYKPASDAVKKETVFTISCVWILIAGRYLYERRVDEGIGADEVDLTLREGKLPWYRNYDITSARWRFWCRRLEEEAQNEELSREVRSLCAKCVATTLEMEQSISQRVEAGGSSLGTMRSLDSGEIE